MEPTTRAVTVRDDGVTIPPDRRYVPHIAGQAGAIPHTRTPSDEPDYPTGLDNAAKEAEWLRKPPNTRRTYLRGFTEWSEFCGRYGLPVTKARHGSLTMFTEWAWHEKHRAPATIDTYLSGIAVVLDFRYDVRPDPGDLAAARKAIASLRKTSRREQEPERGRGKAPALGIDALREIVRGMDLSTAAGLRDRLVFSLGFAIAGRRDELAHLTVGDLDLVDEGLTVHVRVSKTDPREVAVAYGTDPLTCPVRAWIAWRDYVGLVPVADAVEPVIRRVHRSGAVHGGMSGAGVGEIVKRRAAAAGLEVPFTGHSLRAGLVTSARRAGKDAKAISEVTGHRPNSKVLYGYMRDVDRWRPENNATMGIGL
jgi:integrase